VGEGFRKAIPGGAWTAALWVMSVFARPLRETGWALSARYRLIEQIQISTHYYSRRGLSCNLVVKTPATHSQNGRSTSRDYAFVGD
jgi:hypothetical protein